MLSHCTLLCFSCKTISANPTPPFLSGTLSQLLLIFLTPPSNEPDNSYIETSKSTSDCIFWIWATWTQFPNAAGKLKFPESGVSLIVTLMSQAKQSIFCNLSHSVLQKVSTSKSMWVAARSWLLLFQKRQPAAFWTRQHQLFWCFKRSLCSFKCRKDQLYRLEVKAMRSSPPLRDGSSSWLRCPMLCCIKTLKYRKVKVSSGLAENQQLLLMSRLNTHQLLPFHLLISPRH